MGRKQTKNKGGRPPKPPGERRSKWVLIRLTPGEHHKFFSYAKRLGVSTAQFLRQLALREIGYRSESRKEEK